MSTYLVWSNHHHAYWGASGGYTTNWLTAGRFNSEQAAERCSRRTWEPGKPPPEVMILAPDSERDSFHIAELCAIPAQLQELIRKATRAAIRERNARETVAVDA
ncbi:hypothetical protein [Nonomuraea gerenzanensis]|uniref:Uncharacterized protein n=1 Tax=Nonomuraea gerenzanensis TaxID=93944 RepID=A0A1M4BL99_9ACTN|nr:hypothetical protein [Nonomuraea gerenzanensis]UBU10000.1 hypothetical protein LCN96_37365 [Nonomuraea gerenzanensis]SAP16291.1 hypothetical protein BN4615_P10954 [Nonomuraea gerenzanensis]